MGKCHYTLDECKTFTEECCVLIGQIGADFFLSIIVSSMLARKDWRAVAFFSRRTYVMERRQRSGNRRFTATLHSGEKGGKMVTLLLFRCNK